MDVSGKLDDNTMKMLIDEGDKIEYLSNFDFLLSHNGLRRGCVHTLLGASHGGKSTLVRTMIMDFLSDRKKKKKVLIWLSEESRIEFLTEFGRTSFRRYDDDQLYIFSEMDYPETKDVMMTIHELVKQYDVDLILYDNITTGLLYMDKRVEEQSRFLKKIKRMVADLNIPCVLVAHTGAAVTENSPRLIDMNDVRGSKTLVNISQFFYIMQTFYEDSKKHSTVRITKHRGQEVTESIFLLDYFPRGRVYGKDEPMSFADFKEIFKSRNKL